MKSLKTASIAFAAVVLGLGLGFVLERAIPPANAGGVCEGSLRHTYVTSSEDGSALYEWNVGPSPAVVIYDARMGTAWRKDLRPKEGEAAPPRKAPGAEGETPDIVISGVIWTPNAEDRVAIINGKSVREGEVFETKSGKKYKVVEIKRNEEVETVEVK
jgi:hypothetical protein